MLCIYDILTADKVLARLYFVQTYHCLTNISRDSIFSFTAIRSIRRYIINEKGLSILSIRRNRPGMIVSEWVDSLFGPSAKFGTKDVLLPNGNSIKVAKEFKLPASANNSQCSFEFLGFVKLVDGTPFTESNNFNLVFGEAPMVITQSSVPWTCYYRSMTESWRVPRVYWPIIFYCPAPNNAICTGHHEMETDMLLTGQLKMDIHNTTWKTRFPLHFEKEPAKPTACLVLPYRTSIPEKADVNGAMLYEWVRYYSMLGFKIIIYDRNGANRQYIFNSTYGAANNQQGMNWTSNVVYLRHTVFGLLNKAHLEAQYDNVGTRGPAVDPVRLDDDKTATLTHCRFEANALYGSTKVLVADFDEFLYCPKGASTFSGQKFVIHSVMDRYSNDKVNQLIFFQIYPSDKLDGGKYSTVLDCLTDKVKNGSSIFDCYSSFEFNTGIVYIGKSIHLGYKCPLTDFHGACNNQYCHCPLVMYPMENAEYAVMPSEDQCYFMHLSTHPRDYVANLQLSNESRRIFESTPSELSLIVNKKDEYEHIRVHAAFSFSQVNHAAG
jgi:hypothetical protein